MTRTSLRIAIFSCAATLSVNRIVVPWGTDLRLALPAVKRALDSDTWLS